MSATAWWRSRNSARGPLLEVRGFEPLDALGQRALDALRGRAQLVELALLHAPVNLVLGPADLGRGEVFDLAAGLFLIDRDERLDLGYRGRDRPVGEAAEDRQH